MLLIFNFLCNVFVLFLLAIGIVFVCPSIYGFWLSSNFWDSHVVVSIQYCVHQPHPPFKMAAVTKNRNFFNYLLLLYYRSKWAQILSAATWPLSAIFRLYHGDQFYWWKKPEYPDRTTDHGQATGKLYHLRLWVECTLFLIYKAVHEPTPYWW